MEHSKKMCRVFGLKETEVHREIWGDLTVKNPGLVAMIDYLNSGDEKNMQKTLCPHCGCSALTRSSKQMSKLVKHSTCACLNAACGHVFIASVEAIRTISPAAFPDPEVAAVLMQSSRMHAGSQQAEASNEQHFAEGKKMT